MSNRAKTIFLSLSIFGSFFIYCVYYYSKMIQNAPYRSYELESIVFKYGEGNNLINQFDSRTNTYQYLNASDSLVSTTVHLNKDDFIYIHHKAAELGFWYVIDVMTHTAHAVVVTKFTLLCVHFNYKQKSILMLVVVKY